MRIGNLDDRLVLIQGDRALDVERASAGRFGPDPQRVYDTWAPFEGWARTASFDAAAPFDPARLGSPAPRPRQVFAIGLNYRKHAAETGFREPEHPLVFTKFPSCITGPHGEIELPEGAHVDWEVEVVAVLKDRVHRAAPGWSAIAGLAVGQDISDRVSQMRGQLPQFNLGKSFPRFGPIGPWLVTPDALPDKDDLGIGSSIDGEVMQQSRTSAMIFPIPDLIARLAKVVTLYPGDVIFTGTPDGVGLGRSPQRWLRDGEELVSWVEGIGEMRHRFVRAV